MKVHILVTSRPGQETFSTLVFDTLRIGFPTADVIVHLNGALDTDPAAESPDWVKLVAARCKENKCAYSAISATIHHEWIGRLIREETGPFWICDTDMIFYKSVEDWGYEPNELVSVPLVGALIPEFKDEFTNTVTRARLHTSLLLINPHEIGELARAWLARHPATPFNPPINLVDPVMVPLNHTTYFYDTMALAYHAIGGLPLTAQQKDCYFHFHFGTLGDVVLPHLSNRVSVEHARKVILADPEKGRGLWRAQEEYFAARQFNQDGLDVIAPISPEDADEARKWNLTLCCGNETAMTFCGLWYDYCHGIDDLVDTLRDGRPRMSKDQIVSLFFKAALLYNCDFYKANSNLLAPIVLQVTNTYRDSIAWEFSPVSHLRQMADVFRTCGNEMFVMVALLCGGEAHMRKMSMAIKERDWVGQHTKDGVPL